MVLKSGIRPYWQRHKVKEWGDTGATGLHKLFIDLILADRVLPNPIFVSCGKSSWVVSQQSPYTFYSGPSIFCCPIFCTTPRTDPTGINSGPGGQPLWTCSGWFSFMQMLLFSFRACFASMVSSGTFFPSSFHVWSSSLLGIWSPLNFSRIRDSCGGLTFHLSSPSYHFSLWVPAIDLLLITWWRKDWTRKRKAKRSKQSFHFWDLR